MLPRLIHVFRPIVRACSCAIANSLSLRCFAYTQLDTQQFLLFDLPIAVAWALAALVGTGLAYFLSFHLYVRC